MDADRRGIFRLRQLPLALQLPLGFAHALRQFVDDVLRHRRRRPLPGRRQEIDEQLLAGRHHIDGDILRERDADRGAVGIPPRRADIIGRKLGQTIDGDVDRALEADDQNVTVNLGAGLDILPGAEQKTRIAVVRRDRQRGLEGLCRRGGHARSRRERQYCECKHADARRSRPAPWAAAAVKNSDKRCTKASDTKPNAPDGASARHTGLDTHSTHVAAGETDRPMPAQP